MRLHTIVSLALLLAPTARPVAAQDPRIARMKVYLQAAARPPVKVLRGQVSVCLFGP
jgi:hypothetical protein